jgi:dihydrofolate reductase
VECLTGDVTQLFDDVLEPRYENIWLVDDLRVSVVPVLLGEGTPFVEQVGGDRPLHLKEVTPYKNGIVELWYGLRQ